MGPNIFFWWGSIQDRKMASSRAVGRYGAQYTRLVPTHIHTQNTQFSAERRALRFFRTGSKKVHNILTIWKRICGWPLRRATFDPIQLISTMQFDCVTYFFGKFLLLLISRLCGQIWNTQYIQILNVFFFLILVICWLNQTRNTLSHNKWYAYTS